jgi:energy-coupling factor transporter transmembrane protein EcfT
MLQNISLGVYYPGTSVVHRLRARTKLLALLGIIAWFVIANHREWHFAPYPVIAAITVLAAAQSGISFGQLARRVRLILFAAVLGGLIGLFAGSDNPSPAILTLGPVPATFEGLRWGVTGVAVALVVVLAAGLVPLVARGRRGPRLRTGRTHTRRRGVWLAVAAGPLALVATVAAALLWGGRSLLGLPARFAVGPVVITRDGVWFLMSISVVLIVLYTLSLVLTMTTTPMALVEGLTMLLAPLRRLRLPVDDFALMTLIALRFVPTLLDETDQLIQAQAARGADLAHGSVRDRVGSLVALIVPLLRGALRRAEELATALEARGYAPGGQQTPLHEGPLAAADYAVLAGLVVAAVVSLWA